MIWTYYFPEDFNEDEIRRWLEGFGQIEEVFLLRDVVARMSMVTKPVNVNVRGECSVSDRCFRKN